MSLGKPSPKPPRFQEKGASHALRPGWEVPTVTCKELWGREGVDDLGPFCKEPPQLSELSVCTGSSREFCLAGSVAFVPQMGTQVCEGPFPAPHHTAGTQTLVSPMSRSLPALFCFLIVLVHKSGRACRLVSFLVRPGSHSFVDDCYLLIRKDRGR